jgi:hypothetical protein
MIQPQTTREIKKMRDEPTPLGTCPTAKGSVDLMVKTVWCTKHENIT